MRGSGLGLDSLLLQEGGDSVRQTDWVGFERKTCGRGPSPALVRDGSPQSHPQEGPLLPCTPPKGGMQERRPLQTEKKYSALPEEHPQVQHHLPDHSSRCPGQDVDPQTKPLHRQAASPVAGGYLPPTYLPPTYVPAPHVLRLGAHSGAVAAPTDLLLDQVLYAVVHLQVLQETEPWLATGSWGQAGHGHTDLLPRDVPVEARAMGQLFLEGNEAQPYAGAARHRRAGVVCKTCCTPGTETHQHIISPTGCFPPVLAVLSPCRN